MAGVCEAGCAPDCGESECGDDGCDGTCGDCDQGESCQEGWCVPDIWTCDPALYEDGETCDCACGGVDPDCEDAALPVVGCAEGMACEEGACAPVETESCAGRCGQVHANASCQCHMACFAEGTCCDDACDVCADELGAACEPCAAQCEGRVCGDDGCGGSCGGCPADHQCGPDGQCHAKGPDTITGEDTDDPYTIDVNGADIAEGGGGGGGAHSGSSDCAVGGGAQRAPLVLVLLALVALAWRRKLA